MNCNYNHFTLPATDKLYTANHQKLWLYVLRFVLQIVITPLLHCVAFAAGSYVTCKNKAEAS